MTTVLLLEEATLPIEFVNIQSCSELSWKKTKRNLHINRNIIDIWKHKSLHFPGCQRYVTEKGKECGIYVCFADLTIWKTAFWLYICYWKMFLCSFSVILFVIWGTVLLCSCILYMRHGVTQPALKLNISFALWAKLFLMLSQELLKTFWGKAKHYQWYSCELPKIIECNL